MTAQVQHAPGSLSELLVGGMEILGEQLDTVRPEEWDRLTPCAGWTVSDLTRHAADTADRATAILRGVAWQASTSPAAPLERWAESTAALRKVVADTDMDDRWPLPSDSPQAKLQFHGCDFVVHSWDLAVARGQERELPVGWVTYMEEFFRSQPSEVLRRPRAFDDALEPAEGDGPTRRLMAFLGRRAPR